MPRGCAALPPRGVRLHKKATGAAATGGCLSHHGFGGGGRWWLGRGGVLVQRTRTARRANMPPARLHTGSRSLTHASRRPARHTGRAPPPACVSASRLVECARTPGNSDAALGMVGVSDGPPIVPCAIRLVDDGRAVLELGAHLCRRATPGHEHGGRATAARSARGESAGAAAHGGPARTGRAGQARDQHRHARGEDGLAAGCRQHWPRPHCLQLPSLFNEAPASPRTRSRFGVVKWFVT